MTDPDLEPILAYLREHSGRYDIEALREQLLLSGHDPAAVDRGIAVFQHEQHENPPAQERLWPKMMGVVGIDFGLLVITILLLFSGGGSVDDKLFTGLAGLYGLQLFAGLVLSFPASSRRWGLALFLGFFLYVGLGLLILTGVCMVAGNMFGRI